MQWVKVSSRWFAVALPADTWITCPIKDTIRTIETIKEQSPCAIETKNFVRKEKRFIGTAYLHKWRDRKNLHTLSPARWADVVAIMLSVFNISEDWGIPKEPDCWAPVSWRLRCSNADESLPFFLAKFLISTSHWELAIVRIESFCGKCRPLCYWRSSTFLSMSHHRFVVRGLLFAVYFSSASQNNEETSQTWNPSQIVSPLYRALL